MRQFKIADKIITDDNTYVIAEIGSNHNGDFERACKMVEIAASCGVDAVKFQKRYNDELFAKELLDSDYDNENSYGKTYGEHRQALDWFDEIEFNVLKALTRIHDIDFIVTPFEWRSAHFLDRLDIDAFKIASCDVNSPQLIKQIAGYKKPIILSTGGARQWEIGAAVNILNEKKVEFAILHCVSLYPNSDEDLNLIKIASLRKQYPNKIIGFSSHHPGLQACMNAYWMGARIFEVHFTLNRADKGTDHGFSLEPAGLRQLCDDLKRIPTMIGDGQRNDNERNGFVKKFGKSLYAYNNIKSGTLFHAELFAEKAPKNGICASKIGVYEGKRIKNDIKAGEVLREEDFD